MPFKAIYFRSKAFYAFSRVLN